VKPYYDESKVDEVIREFEKIKDFLEGDQFELEQILNQLYKDLNPNEINDIIINGRCKKCP
jgi:redox-regulated HSP33 family molecular chaperone